MVLVLALVLEFGTGYVRFGVCLWRPAVRVVDNYLEITSFISGPNAIADNPCMRRVY